jgi:DDE family transposase
MLNEVAAILSAFDLIPKRLFNVVHRYIFFLTLSMRRHDFRVASQLTGLHESRFSSLLNDSRAPEMSRTLLNRAVRRRLKKIKRTDGRLVFIIDATVVGRRGKKVENVRKQHTGSGFANGHKFVNFVVLDGNTVIPLASVPLLTKKYARENKLSYRSEPDIVVEWVNLLRDQGYFAPEELRQSIFLLDSGYDAKKIQHAIKGIGADFVMALKSSRTINGKKVTEFFRRTKRWLPWEPIRLHVGSGNKKSRRNYSIRTARDANMKGFGLVHVVCSKAIGRKGKPQKFLATSDLEMTGREIVLWYSRRWRIETWHKEMKQNFGFIDCRASRFTAIESHVNFSLIAYLIQKEIGGEQMRVEEYVRRKELRAIKIELTRFGSVARLKTRIDAALQRIAA